jgi:hypothetical protein
LSATDWLLVRDSHAARETPARPAPLKEGDRKMERKDKKTKKKEARKKERKKERKKVARARKGKGERERGTRGPPLDSLVSVLL